MNVYEALGPTFLRFGHRLRLTSVLSSQLSGARGAALRVFTMFTMFTSVMATRSGVDEQRNVRVGLSIRKQFLFVTQIERTDRETQWGQCG